TLVLISLHSCSLHTPFPSLFFFNDTATTEIYTLSLHDALPICTVKNITDFGAFIDLNGLDGLLHITDMSWGRIGHPSEILKVGQEIDIVVLDINREKERVSLGLKQKLTNPWENIETKYPVGARVKGKVVNLVPYGAFVELEPGVEGL